LIYWGKIEFLRVLIIPEIQLDFNFSNFAHLLRDFQKTLTFRHSKIGDIAQLARACGWQPQGQGFETPYLHLKPKNSNSLALRFLNQIISK
jgi:hypothetical protein